VPRWLARCCVFTHHDKLRACATFICYSTANPCVFGTYIRLWDVRIFIFGEDIYLWDVCPGTLVLERVFGTFDVRRPTICLFGVGMSFGDVWCVFMWTITFFDRIVKTHTHTDDLLANHER